MGNKYKRVPKRKTANRYKDFARNMREAKMKRRLELKNNPEGLNASSLGENDEVRDLAIHRENYNNDYNDYQPDPTTSNTPVAYIEIVPDSTQTGWQLLQQEPERTANMQPVLPPPLLPLQPVTKQPSQKPRPVKSQPVKKSRPKPKEDTTLTRRTSKRLRIDPTSKQNQPTDPVEDFTNEFDVFGRFVAMQLKNLSDEDAVLAQSEIQEVLIRYRLNKIKARYDVPVTNAPSVSKSEQIDGPSDAVSIEVEELIVKCEPDSDSEICAGQ